MIHEIFVRNRNSEVLRIDLWRPQESGFAVVNVEGLGPPKADVITTDMLMLDGGVYNSARTQNRNIVFQLLYYDDVSIETARLRSYKYFPIKSKVDLMFVTDNRRATIQGYVESVEPTIFSKQSSVTVSIVCPAPFFEKSDENFGTKTRMEFSATEPLFEFPFEDSPTPSLQFGRVLLTSEENVYYEGDISNGMRFFISFSGPVTGLRVSKRDLTNAIVFDDEKIRSITGGWGLDASARIEISSVARNKYVRYIRGTTFWNILNALNVGFPWLTVDPGDNIFRYDADGDTSKNVKFALETQTLYEGV